MRSRKPQLSSVQPGVMALGKKKSTTFFRPLKSASDRVGVPFFSGRTLSIWVAGKLIAGAGWPSRTASCAPVLDIMPNTPQPTDANPAARPNQCVLPVIGVSFPPWIAWNETT